MGEAPTLLKNFAPQINNSIEVRVVTSRRDAIGARVAVTSGGRTQIDEVRSGGSFISQNDFRLHFGIGKSASADLSVRWPDGKSETFPAVAANQIVTVEQGRGIIRKQPYVQAPN
jgi:hypothetical protein